MVNLNFRSWLETMGAGPSPQSQAADITKQVVQKTLDSVAKNGNPISKALAKNAQDKLATSPTSDPKAAEATAKSLVSAIPDAGGEEINKMKKKMKKR